MQQQATTYARQLRGTSSRTAAAAAADVASTSAPSLGEHSEKN
jgi:hypothetical protein